MDTGTLPPPFAQSCPRRLSQHACCTDRRRSKRGQGRAELPPREAATLESYPSWRPVHTAHWPETCQMTPSCCVGSWNCSVLPEHVHHFPSQNSKEEEEDGKAQVVITGGRPGPQLCRVHYWRQTVCGGWEEAANLSNPLPASSPEGAAKSTTIPFTTPHGAKTLCVHGEKNKLDVSILIADAASFYK